MCYSHSVVKFCCFCGLDYISNLSSYSPSLSACSTEGSHPQHLPGRDRRPSEASPGPAATSPEDQRHLHHPCHLGHPAQRHHRQRGNGHRGHYPGTGRSQGSGGVCSWRYEGSSHPHGWWIRNHDYTAIKGQPSADTADEATEAGKTKNLFQPYFSESDFC